MTVPPILYDQFVIGIFQLLLGKWAKGQEAIQNWVIPVLTYIAALLGFTFLPASAHAASAFPLGPVLNVFAAAFVQNLLVTGIHSTMKNTVLTAAKKSALFVLGKLSKEQS